MHRLLLVCGLLLAALLPAHATSQSHAPAAPEAPSALPSERYTKYEFRIPMRDGAKLFTVVHIPKDQSRTYPFLMVRTPYGVGQFQPHSGRIDYGVDFTGRQLGPSPEFDQAGYIYVMQDVRGRFLSDGRWTEMQPHIPVKKSAADTDASSDMYDTVEWLLKHVPGHNGRVGLWGVSYSGFYTSASIIDSHPAIKAASPQAPMADMYMGDDSYHGGAFMLAANYGFYTFFTPQTNPTPKLSGFRRFDYGTSDGYAYFLRLGSLAEIAKSLDPEAQPYFIEQMENTSYGDYWKSRSIAPHLKNIRAAVLTVGGWFDAEDLQGSFSTFQAIEKNNPGIVNALVIGPWTHGSWGEGDGSRLGPIDFRVKTGAYFRSQLLFPFFEQHLRGAASAADAKPVPPAAPTPPLAKATVFETGTNVWRRYDAWPPKQARSRTLYFQPGGGLSFDAPAATDGRAFDEYVSDPAKPVPFTTQITTGMPREYMVGDQRFAASRPDVLVYQTPPLEDDVTIVGPVSPRLFVSSTGSDADWVVKLIDVYPSAYPEAESPKDNKPDPSMEKVTLAGYQQLVRGEPLRSKFRNSFETPEPLLPGAVTPIRFRMPDVGHTFRRGHRIMVQVQSSWFPLIDRNPQTFVDIPNARPQDFRAATQRVYRGAGQASGVEVLTLPAIGEAKAN